jgi:hypothetical protein
VRWPEEQGIGAVPVCSAKFASERKRSVPAVWPIRIAAVSAPHPRSANSLGAVRGDQLSQLCLEPIDLAVEAAQTRDLVAGDPHARVGGQLAQPAVDAVEHARVVERAALERALKLRAQLEELPPQPIDRACSLGDELSAVIEPKADLHRPLV